MRGKAVDYTAPSGVPRDHPRVCGEKSCINARNFVATGSPPRMRGKAFPLLVMPTQSRITPAYAGKRGHRRFGPGTIRDHPRVCGEKGSSTFWSRNHSGSPPRMRGKVLFKTLGEGTFGITPACAGKRMVFAGRKSRTWDHPRVCGEKGSSTFWSRNHSGSPPRMRGKEETVPEFYGLRGITPACAGKSTRCRCRLYGLRDHPRVCGEKLAVF